MALAEALHTVSHARLTRRLPADWSGQRLLESAARTLFVWERGSLLSEDTVVPKPFATAMAGLAGVFSSQQGTPVYGVSVVVLSWTAGRGRSPLGLRLGHQGGPSTLGVALALLSCARHRLRRRPADVLFDAW